MFALFEDGLFGGGRLIPRFPCTFGAAVTWGLYVPFMGVGLSQREEAYFFFLLLFLFVNPCGIVENSGVESSGFPRRPAGENEGAEALGLCAF